MHFAWLSIGSGMAAAALTAMLAAEVERPPVERVSPERLLIPIEGGGVHAVPIEWSHDPAVRDEEVRHLMVMVHGFSRRNVFPEILRPMVAGESRRREVAWYAPQFICGQDLEPHGLDERHPYWSANGWVIGHNSRADPHAPRPHRISSFAVIDELLTQALASFPNLESVVIGGFSAGGQFANRYAAGSRVHPLLEEAGVAVRYVVASPSTYLYFCENRLIAREPARFGPVANTLSATCADFHAYRLGMRGLNAYMQAVGPEQLAANYAARHVDYLCGSDDDERAGRDLANGCGARLQGGHRLDRMLVYRDYLVFRFGMEAAARHRVHVVPGVAHGSLPLFDSPTGRGLLLGPSVGR
jgi:hypothetical protein